MRDEEAFLADILACARRTLRFIAGKRLEDFRQDEVLQHAVIRQLEIIGEAAKRITPQTRQQLPNLPFQDMARMRDLLVHVYWGVRLEIVWSTASNDLPPLVAALEGHFKALGLKP